MDKKPKGRKPNPLDLVEDIGTPENAPGNQDPAASVAAVKNITTQADALRSKARQAAQAPVKGGETVVDPRSGAKEAAEAQRRLSEQEGAVDEVLDEISQYPPGLIPPEMLAELEGYKTMLRMDNLKVTAQKAAFEEEIKAYERNKLIETRLKPLTIEDLFLKQTVSQEIPVMPGKMEITVRSLSGRMRLLIRDMLWQEVLSWTHAKGDEGQQLETLRHLCLAVQVGSLTGGATPWPYPASEISKLVSERKDDSEKRAREMIKENMHWWEDRPERLASEVYGHVLSFEVRLRVLLRHAGWEETVKK